LLRVVGVIFVSIDDTEVHNLRMVLNEVFGEENFVTNLVWEKKYSPQNDARWFSDTHDHILVYARNKELWRPHLLPRTEEADARYQNIDDDPRGPWEWSNLSVKSYSAKYDYPIQTPSGRIVHPPESRCWAVPEEQFHRLVADNRIWFGPTGNNTPSLKRFLSEVQGGMVAKTLWPREEVGDNQEAKQELKAILSGVDIVFDTPKPVRLMKRMLQLATTRDEGALVLDFFAGSCSLAQAVAELNSEDDGNRRFIMVQLPEPTNNPQYPTIADIGKERILRVFAKLRDEEKGKLGLTTRKEPEDLGFRVFKLASSNYKQWKGMDASDPEAYAKQLDMFADPLVENWNPVSVLWEVAVKEGYGLNTSINQLESIKENTVWQVSDPDREQSFLICLDDQLQPVTISALPLSKEQLFVCRNKALNDTKAANLALQCRLKKI